MVRRLLASRRKECGARQCAGYIQLEHPAIFYLNQMRYVYVRVGQTSFGGLTRRRSAAWRCVSHVDEEHVNAPALRAAAYSSRRTALRLLLERWHFHDMFID